MCICFIFKNQLLLQFCFRNNQQNLPSRKNLIFEIKEQTSRMSVTIKATYMTKQQYNRKYSEQKSKRLVCLRTMELHHGVKQLHFCQKQQLAVLVTADSILVASTLIGQITCIIKKLSYPRSVSLSQNGKMILAYYSDNTASLMDTRGRQISNILGIPRLSNVFILSKDGKKVMFGSNQEICIWNVQKAEIQVMSRQWKNINCFALSQTGTEFALGTYSGLIIVLKKIAPQKVSQFQIKRHAKCVMCLAFHKHSIMSVSYDKIFIQTIIQTNENNQKILTYIQNNLNEVPRSLIPCGPRVYFSYREGIFWFDEGKLVGLAEGVWKVFEDDEKQMIFVKYDKAKIEWWKFQ